MNIHKNQTEAAKYYKSYNRYTLKTLSYFKRYGNRKHLHCLS